MEDMEINKVSNYWKDRKVLVSGHEGFLGSWLAKTLLSYRAKIIGVDKVANRPISMLTGLRSKMVCLKADITKLSSLRGIIDKYKPQDIFHTAAESIVVVANKNPLRTFRANIEGTWNILEAARGRKFIQCIVIASSDKAYGIQSRLPYREDSSLAGCHPYDVSKSCADLMAYTYFHTYGLPVCVTRCGNIFGPGDFNFSRIVPNAIRCALLDKTFYIRSDGRFLRDYIYIEDIIVGYLNLAQKMQKLKLFGEAFNLGNKKPFSVLELVKIIFKLANKKPHYRILDQAQDEIRNQYLSAEKAKKILGWKPEYTLEEGLKKTIDWYRNSLGGL